MAEEHVDPTLEQNPNPTTANTGLSAGDAADASFRKGIAKERTRWQVRLEEDLSRYNVKPVKDDKGRLDLGASMALLVKAGQPEAAAALEQRYSGRIAELTSTLSTREAELLRMRITTTVREKITLQGPADIDDATDLFMMRYNIKTDDDTGEFVVCDKVGNPLHHKITAAPLTIQDAVEQFFDNKPNLRNQTKGAGLQGLGSMKGAPSSTQKNEDLQDQYVEALNAGDHATATRIKTDMKKRIRIGLES